MAVRFLSAAHSKTSDDDKGGVEMMRRRRAYSDSFSEEKLSVTPVSATSCLPGAPAGDTLEDLETVWSRFDSRHPSSSFEDLRVSPPEYNKVTGGQQFFTCERPKGYKSKIRCSKVHIDTRASSYECVSPVGLTFDNKSRREIDGKKGSKVELRHSVTHRDQNPKETNYVCIGPMCIDPNEASQEDSLRPRVPVITLSRPSDATPPIEEEGANHPGYDMATLPLPDRRWSEQGLRPLPSRVRRKLSDGSCITFRADKYSCSKLKSHLNVSDNDSGFLSSSDISGVELGSDEDGFKLVWTFSDGSKTTIPLIYPTRPSESTRSDSSYARSDRLGSDNVFTEDENDNVTTKKQYSKQKSGLGSFFGRTASEPELDKLDETDFVRRNAMMKRKSVGVLDRVDLDMVQNGRKIKSFENKKPGGTYRRKFSDSAIFRRLSVGSLRRLSMDSGRGSSSSGRRNSSSSSSRKLSDCLSDMVGYVYHPGSDSDFCSSQDGDYKDYQLWVLSGKEESPYPLIGK